MLIYPTARLSLLHLGGRGSLLNTYMNAWGVSIHIYTLTHTLHAFLCKWFKKMTCHVPGTIIDVSPLLTCFFFLKSLQQSRNVGIVISILQRKWEAPWITWPISRSWKVGNLAPVGWLQGRWLSQPKQSMLCPSREEDWEHERQPWGFWREVSESDGETTGLDVSHGNLGWDAVYRWQVKTAHPRWLNRTATLDFSL